MGSSAALEVATAMAFKVCSCFELEGIKMAEICRKTENEFVGVQYETMDQLTSALGKNGTPYLSTVGLPNIVISPFPKN